MTNLNKSTPDNDQDPLQDPLNLQMMEFMSKVNESARKLGLTGMSGFTNPTTHQSFYQSIDGSEVPEDFLKRLEGSEE